MMLRPGLVFGAVALVLAACMADPQLEPFQAAEQTTSPSRPAPPDGDASSADAQVASDASAPPLPDDASVDDAATPPTDASSPPPPPPPPPPATCPPAGAPAGTACCGAGGTPPPCIGLACAHCGDCVARGCPSGMICCAMTAGKSDNYKGMMCRIAALAGSCP